MSHLCAYISDGPCLYRTVVCCYRDDLRIGDEVYIVWHTGEYRTKAGYGIIRKLLYLGGVHDSLVICKASEMTDLDKSNASYQKRYLRDLEFRPLWATRSPYPGPNKLDPLVFKGVLNHYDFICRLAEDGWKTVRPIGYVKQRGHEIQTGIYLLRNDSVTVLIYLRQYLVDLQIIDGHLSEEDVPLRDQPLDELGRVAQHSFVDTGFNLYEGLLRFSKSVLRNEADLNRYFVSQGNLTPLSLGSQSFLSYKKWRTPGGVPRHLERLEWMRKGKCPNSEAHRPGTSRSRSENVDIYEALSQGDNEPVYLSDGMWLEPDGRIVDKGR